MYMVWLGVLRSAGQLDNQSGPCECMSNGGWCIAARGVRRRPHHPAAACSNCAARDDADRGCFSLPQVMYGAGPTIQLLLGSGAHHYLEFKLVQGRCGSYGIIAAHAVTLSQPPQRRSAPSSN